jgi:hypothetical protein
MQVEDTIGSTNHRPARGRSRCDGRLLTIRVENGIRILNDKAALFRDSAAFFTRIGERKRILKDRSCHVIIIIIIINSGFLTWLKYKLQSPRSVDGAYTSASA